MRAYVVIIRDALLSWCRVTAPSAASCRAHLFHFTDDRGKSCGNRRMASVERRALKSLGLQCSPRPTRWTRWPSRRVSDEGTEMKLPSPIDLCFVLISASPEYPATIPSIRPG